MSEQPHLDRDRENPDPEELHKPVPKVVLGIIAVLLAWAIGYIIMDSPGLGSSSVPADSQPSIADDDG